MCAYRLVVVVSCLTMCFYRTYKFETENFSLLTSEQQGVNRDHVRDIRLLHLLILMIVFEAYGHILPLYNSKIFQTDIKEI